MPVARTKSFDMPKWFLGVKIAAFVERFAFVPAGLIVQGIASRDHCLELTRSMIRTCAPVVFVEVTGTWGLKLLKKRRDMDTMHME